MKVVLTGKDWFPNIAGGLNRYFYGQVHSLAKLGIQGSAVVSWKSHEQVAPLALYSIAPLGAPLLRRIYGVRTIVKNLLRDDVAMIHSHFALYSYPWVRSLPRNVAHVVHFHGPYADEISMEDASLKRRLHARLARHMEATVYQHADCIITLSKAFGTYVHDRYNIPWERIQIIPGGISIEPYLHAPERQIARMRLGWPLDRPILLTVRRLARRMGLENLIEAMREVRQRHPKVLLLIGGKGHLTTQLQAMIEAYGLEDNVRLLGFISDEQLPLAYASADITVVPSLALEGFGLVTVESLASGTPVLGTNVGGTPEILHGLCPDLIFTSSLASAMAERICSTLCATSQLPNAETCRNYAKYFGWENVGPKIHALYSSLAG